MPFQESSETLQSKLHLEDVRPSALIAVLVVAAVVATSCVFGVVRLVASHSFSVQSDGAAVASAEEGAEDEEPFTDVNDAGVVSAASLIYVHVSGYVANPGLYSIPEGSRVADAVEAAGGASGDGDLDAINLARVVVDGEQVYVPSGEEASAGTAAAPYSTGASGASGGSGLININTATAEELTALSGVGDATAQKIVVDRTQNGPFASIEDIKRVSGIGDKKFEAIKDAICV